MNTILLTPAAFPGMRRIPHPEILCANFECEEEEIKKYP